MDFFSKNQRKLTNGLFFAYYDKRLLKLNQMKRNILKIIV